MLDSIPALLQAGCAASPARPGGAARRAAALLAALLAPVALLGPADPAFAGPAAAPSRAAPGAPAAAAWVDVRSPAELDAAFARARRESRPLLLYWGAAWCPPCQHLQATLFPRADFVAASRRFIAVHLDGDVPGAQQAGARFAVRGYPTLVLFDPQGRELTRLPGEVDAPKVMQALQAALAGEAAAPRSAADLARAALRGEALDDAAWRQLAWYSWDTDEGRLAAQAAPGSNSAALLARLARACPPSAAAPWVRLQLKAALAAQDGGGKAALDEAARRDAGAALLRLLGDGALVREQVDLATGTVRELVPLLAAADGAERTQVTTLWTQAARRLQAEAGLSRADRLSAWVAEVELQRLARGEAAGAPWVDAALATSLRGAVAKLVGEVSGQGAEATAERQTLVTTGAHALARAGLWDDAERLLTGHLSTSPWPYYLMSQLASTARARGDAAASLRWYGKAWQAARGTATRAQWGATYLGALVDTTPQAAGQIERTAATVLAELARSPDGHAGRNKRSLQRVGATLAQWNAMGDQSERMARLARAAAPLCARWPAGSAERSACAAPFSGDRAAARP